MEIGGYDVVFDNLCGTNAAEVFAAIRELWPHARFEDANGDGASLTESIPDVNEFFIYRNFAAHRAINKVGLEDYLQKDFIHVILQPLIDQATLVVGQLDEETDEMASLFRSKFLWKKAYVE